MFKSALKEYAQTIVENAHQTIGYNILITDEKGVILGTNQKERLGSLHSHSLHVIDCGLPESISETKAERYKVEKGICLPIWLGNKKIGTVAISGDPAEVTKFGHLVQKETELFLNEKLSQEMLFVKRNAVFNLVNQLIAYDERDRNESFLVSQAESLGYNLSHRKKVILVDILKFKDIVNKITAEEAYPHDAEFRIQTVKTIILNLIREVYCSPDDIISNLGSDKYIIIYDIPDYPSEYDSNQIREKSNQLVKKLEANGYISVIGTGYLAKSMKDIKNSFRSAWDTINIEKRLYSSYGAYNITDFLLEELLLSGDRDKVKLYIDKNLSIFNNSKIWNEELELTLREWLANPLQPGEVAKKLNIHRNSLYYRIERLNKLLSVDLKNIDDLFKIKISILLRDLYYKKN